MKLNIELAGHKILVIDDDDTSRRVARMVLERNGILARIFRKKRFADMLNC